MLYFKACGYDRYSVMLSCWHPSSKQRPSFHQLVESVSDVVDAMQRQLRSRRAAGHYVNTADQPSTTSSELSDVTGSVTQQSLNASRSTVV